MSDEKSMYFSPAEFMVLLELANGPACSFLDSGSLPEDGALTAALAALFRRGLIQREGDGFVLSDSGILFDRLRNAPQAVYISDGTGNIALCYLAVDALWLVDLADVIVATQYRVRRLDRAGLERWLFDSGLLEPPMLADGDVRELEAWSGDLERSSVRPLLRLERHINGGAADGVYEVYKYGSHRRISWNGRDAYYTRETLSDMLTDCFGKEDYDHR